MGPLAANADNRLGNRGHWDRSSSVAHVKFLDFTESPWPVGTASADWDQANNIDVDWVLAEGNPTCLGDCVRVRTRLASEDSLFEPNCAGFAGYWTNGAPDSNNHWRPGNEVRFNRSCNSQPASTRRALTCQELGHALGLDHSNATDSCMFRSASIADVTPGSHQYHMLDQVIYDH